MRPLAPHLLIFIPGLGAALCLAVSLDQERSEDERMRWREAARWQGLAASVLFVHGVLQLGIHVAAGLGEASQMLPGLKVSVGDALFALTLLNLGGGAVEWLVLVTGAVWAHRTGAYPATSLAPRPPKRSP